MMDLLGQQEDLNTQGRWLAGATELQTAGLAFWRCNGPGAPAGETNVTEEYDGSTWTAGGNLGTARGGLGTAGTQTAGLGFGGFSLHLLSVATEEYDGSTWTAGGYWFRHSKKIFFSRSRNTNISFSFWW
jgi:hypothetical protein